MAHSWLGARGEAPAMAQGYNIAPIPQSPLQTIVMRIIDIKFE